MKTTTHQEYYIYWLKNELFILVSFWKEHRRIMKSTESLWDFSLTASTKINQTSNFKHQIFLKNLTKGHQFINFAPLLNKKKTIVIKGTRKFFNNNRLANNYWEKKITPFEIFFPTVFWFHWQQIYQELELYRTLPFYSSRMLVAHETTDSCRTHTWNSCTHTRRLDVTVFIPFRHGGDDRLITRWRSACRCWGPARAGAGWSSSWGRPSRRRPCQRGRRQACCPAQTPGRRTLCTETRLMQRDCSQVPRGESTFTTKKETSKDKNKERTGFLLYKKRSTQKKKEFKKIKIDSWNLNFLR